MLASKNLQKTHPNSAYGSIGTFIQRKSGIHANKQPVVNDVVLKPGWKKLGGCQETTTMIWCNTMILKSLKIFNDLQSRIKRKRVSSHLKLTKSQFA